MSLPWVARSRLEAAQARIRELEAEMVSVEWHREQIEKLTDQLTRVVRRKAGMTELPAQKREPPDPMPAKLRSFIADFDDEFMRRDLTDRAERMHRRDRATWDVILTTFRQEFGLQEAEL